MNKKQILTYSLSILFVGAMLTTVGCIMHYNICPKIKILSYDKQKGSVKIKWGGTEYTFDKSGFAKHGRKYIAKLENNKVNVYNLKDKLLKSYDTNIV